MPKSPDKSLSKDGIKVRRITSLEDWTRRIKKVVEFPRADGTIDEFEVYSIDSETMLDIIDEYKKNLPSTPEMLDPEDKFYAKKRQRQQEEATKQSDHANQILLARYVEHGFLRPNNIPISGDLDEKLKVLKKVIAGDMSKLAGHIAQLSNVSVDDVNFI